MRKIASYILSAYSFIFKCSLEKLLDVGYQLKNGNPIPSFDEKILIDLCSEAQNIFKNEDNLLEIDGDVIVVGDIHGSLHDLLRILHFIQENQTKVLFLGDYVDRGNFSLECITILFALKVIRPDSIFLIRGNHEFDSLCSQYGFKDEILNHHNRKQPAKKTISDINNISDSIQMIQNDVEKDEQRKQYDEYLSNHNDMDCYKYSELLYNAFIDAFSFLPIAAIVNRSTFCIHGGLSPRLELIASLAKTIKRPVSHFEENELLSDVVWSDPTRNISCLYDENPRGRGCLFNQSAVMLFLVKNSLSRIIRGHECVKKGYFKHYNDKLITVFSASSYDTNLGNHSAILKLFLKDDSFQIFHFNPLERLQKCDAAFYKVQPFEKNESKLPSFFSFHHPFLTSHPNIRMVTNKKLNSIPSQGSHNCYFFHELHSKLHSNSPLMKKSMIHHSSSSLLPSFNDNKCCGQNNSLLSPSNEDFSSNNTELEDQQS